MISVSANTLITVVFPSITALLLFYLASHREDKKLLFSTYKERLEKVYIPFYQKHLISMLRYRNFSELNIESRCIFLDILSSNLHLLDTKSQVLYIQFYLAFTNLLEAEDKNLEYPLDKSQEALDKIFNELYLSMLTEYKHLLQKLKLSKPVDN